MKLNVFSHCKKTPVSRVEASRHSLAGRGFSGIDRRYLVAAMQGVVALVCAACGSSEPSSGSAGDPARESEGMGTACDASMCGPTDSQPMPGEDGGLVRDELPMPLVARLNRSQYQYTVSDVLGIRLTDDERNALPRDVPAEGYYSTTVAGQSFSADYVLAYSNLARSLVARLDPRDLTSRFGGCVDDSPECLTAFIEGVGLRLLRRPLSLGDRKTYRALARTVEAIEGADRSDSVAAIVRAMLQSPPFLYRIEAETDGIPGTAQDLSGYELASRLSYFLWQSAPDDELLTFAGGPQQDGQYDPTSLAGQVDRMIADPRFARSRRIFWSDYSLASVASFSSVNRGLAQELQDSLVATLERIAGADAPAQPLTAVFTADEVVMTPGVAELAGAEPRGDGLQTYAVADGVERIGVLTHPGFLAALGTTSFVGRGVFLSSRLLCQDVEPAPDEVQDALTEAAAATVGLTPRAASEHRLSLGGSCVGCHLQFEPIAYAFERYDNRGQYRMEDDENRPLYSKGTLPATSARPKITFNSAVELSSQLGEIEQIQRCFVDNMVEYASGGATKRNSRPGVIATAFAAFRAGGLTYDALVRSVALSDVIASRRAVEVTKDLQ